MEQVAKTEKATINVSVMEMAQIDLLVENLFYTNRSDFIRIAIRNHLALHKDDIDRLFPQPVAKENEAALVEFGGIGIIHLSYKQLRALKEQNKKMALMVMGILIVDEKITVNLLAETVETAKVYGSIKAAKEVVSFITRSGR